MSNIPLTVSQAASEMGLTTDRLSDWIKFGWLKAYQVSPNIKLVYPEDLAICVKIAANAYATKGGGDHFGDVNNMV